MAAAASGYLGWALPGRRRRLGALSELIAVW